MAVADVEAVDSVVEEAEVDPVAVDSAVAELVVPLLLELLPARLLSDLHLRSNSFTIIVGVYVDFPVSPCLVYVLVHLHLCHIEFLVNSHDGFLPCDDPLRNLNRVVFFFCRIELGPRCRPQHIFPAKGQKLLMCSSS